MKRNRKGKAGLLDLLREVNADETRLGRIQALSDYYGHRQLRTEDREAWVRFQGGVLSRKRSKSFMRGYEIKAQELGVVI